MSVRQPRLCGFAPDSDPLHYVLNAGDPGRQIRGSRKILAPIFTGIFLGKQVSQWGETAESKVEGFRPAHDCKGHFTSHRFQPNNNCYNYACNIATNSFAIPGRMNELELTPKKCRLTAARTIACAEKDGLLLIGQAPMKLAEALADEKYLSARRKSPDGHLVALLISKADSKIRWSGDFHWVRCDHPLGRKWSQKDGPDQVTNFDFAGKPISDPSQANFEVNLGPRHHHKSFPLGKVTEARTRYIFASWMYVPFGEVSII